MPKYIREFKIDKSNIIGSTTKQLTVIGDRGAVFNMHVVRGNGNYYNFETRAFTSTFTSPVVRLASTGSDDERAQRN